MAGEKYIEAAVETLRALVAAQINTELAAVETAQSLAANTIPRPVAVYGAPLPNDNRSPLIGVYEESWPAPASQRERLWIVDCTVAIQCTGTSAGPNSIADLARLMRRYVTAVIQVVQGSATQLSGRASLVLQDGDAFAALGDRSALRMVFTQGVQVRIQSP